MLKVKKEHVGKVTITVNGRTIELNEDTLQDDLETLAKDENAIHFIEEVESEEVASEDVKSEDETSENVEAEGETSENVVSQDKPVAKKNK